MDIKADIAIIMRDDEFIKKYNLKRCTVNTSFGPVDRCFFGKVFNQNIMIVYGRFNGQKVPSNMINYQQTIEAIRNVGVKKIIGTFVVGGIKENSKIGDVYIINDIIGIGNYHVDIDQTMSFHNAEMYNPVCSQLTQQLIEAAKKTTYKINDCATYVCFHGWPRIETKAELNFYRNMGWDVVGQTCDPEATVARLMGLCYAAIAVQIDDPIYRENDIHSNIPSNNTSHIEQCRKISSEIVEKFLEMYIDNNCLTCQNASRKNNSFREFPGWFYE